MAQTLAVRADLTDAEYLALRKLALDNGKRLAQLVGAALRDTYDLKGSK